MMPPRQAQLVSSSMKLRRGQWTMPSPCRVKSRPKAIASSPTTSSTVRTAFMLCSRGSMGGFCLGILFGQASGLMRGADDALHLLALATDVEADRRPRRPVVPGNPAIREIRRPVPAGWLVRGEMFNAGQNGADPREAFRPGVEAARLDG